MGLNINTNMAAITSKNNLKKSSNKINKSIEKLSSGMKINRAADDASGLAISEKMKARIRALDTAIVNCEDGINLVSTIEGYIISVQDMVLRMSELTMKSANGILEDVDRKALQEEMDHLGAEIDRLADTANFNNIKVMTGVPSSTVVEKSQVVSICSCVPIKISSLKTKKTAERIQLKHSVYVLSDLMAVI